MSEVKLTVTPELVDAVEASVAKAFEAKEVARKAVHFHGSEVAKADYTEAMKEADKASYVKEIMTAPSAKQSDLIRTVHENRAKAIGGDVDATAGYLVPTVFESDILATFDTYDEVVSDFNIVPFNKPGRVFNLNELSTRVQVYRGVGEDYSGATASTPTYTEPQIAIDNYIGTVTIKEDFLEDTEADIMSNLSRQFGEAFNQTLQNTMINSTITVSSVVSKGVFVKGNGATTVSHATTASGYTAVGASDIEKMYFTAIALDHFQASNKNGKFYMHPLVMQALRANIRAAGTENDYISLFDGTNPTIMGRPVVFTNQAPTPATTVADPYVLYGDLGKHVQVRRKRGLQMKINDQGTTLDGRNLNYQLGRELVLTMRIGAQLTETTGMVQLVTI